jgi:hypothetical protein
MDIVINGLFIILAAQSRSNTQSGPPQPRSHRFLIRFWLPNCDDSSLFSHSSLGTGTFSELRSQKLHQNKTTLRFAQSSPVGRLSVANAVLSLAYQMSVTICYGGCGGNNAIWDAAYSTNIYIPPVFLLLAFI